LQINEFVSLLDQIVSHQALLMATNDIFWLSGVFFLGLMALSWLTRPPRQGGAPTPADAGAH
jgi:DHA2 family multidrug resistance protein